MENLTLNDLNVILSAIVTSDDELRHWNKNSPQDKATNDARLKENCATFNKILNIRQELVNKL